MIDKSDETRLLEIISENRGIEPERLTDDMLLCHDLGMAGLDGFETLDEIGRAFDIDMSEVDYVKYFGEEASGDLLNMLRLLLSGRRVDERIVPLRISDLKRTVAERKWHEPQGQDGS